MSAEALTGGRFAYAKGRQMDSETEAKIADAGRYSGTCVGSWVFDGNSTTEQYENVRHGYDDGDPLVMDMCPNPLNGEYAGDIVPGDFPQLFDISEEEIDEACDIYESAFADGYWDEVNRAISYQLDDEQ